MILFKWRRENNQKELDEAENFQKLFNAEWNYRINAVCQKRANTISRKKIKTIPITEDLPKLRKYSLSSIECGTDELKTNPNSVTWSKLAKFTLCRLILYVQRSRILKCWILRIALIGKMRIAGSSTWPFSTSDKIFAERWDLCNVCKLKYSWVSKWCFTSLSSIYIISTFIACDKYCRCYHSIK